jgi:SHR-binding domain of vacuolar-sorting associated protein 13
MLNNKTWIFFAPFFHAVPLRRMSRAVPRPLLAARRLLDLDRRTTIIFYTIRDFGDADPLLLPAQILFRSSEEGRVDRVEDSDWSDRFSLDVAASSGTVSCKSPNDDMTYHLGVNFQLSHEGLTKLAVFTPYFIISNSAHFDIQVREVGPTSSATAADSRSLINIPLFKDGLFVFI